MLIYTVLGCQPYSLTLAPFGRPSEGEVWGTCEVCDGQHGIAIEGPGWRRSPPITMSRNLLDMRERDRK
jgi:hypothetical protein